MTTIRRGTWRIDKEKPNQTGPGDRDEQDKRARHLPGSFFSGRLHGGRDEAGGVVSAGTALVCDLSQDVPVRSPVPGADGIDEHLVGVVVVILLRLCGVEK